MELSNEQKQRILGEEQQRLAEEQYRAQVRKDLQSRTGAAAVPTVAPIPSKSNMLRFVLIVACIFVVLCAGVFMIVHLRQTGSKSTPPAPASSVETNGTERSDRPSPMAPPPPAKLTT